MISTRTGTPSISEAWCPARSAQAQIDFDCTFPGGGDAHPTTLSLRAAAAQSSLAVAPSSVTEVNDSLHMIAPLPFTQNKSVAEVFQHAADGLA